VRAQARAFTLLKRTTAKHSAARVYEGQVRLWVKIGLVVLVLWATGARGAERYVVAPLSRPISHFSIGKTSVLDALLWLGRDERICFGIEFSGDELSREVWVNADQSTIGEVVKKILSPAEAYQLSVSDGVILIRKKGVKSPVWLDRRLPQFELPRMELMSADALLWMMLEKDLNPSQQGFLGDSPVTNPIDEVGPIHAHGRTVRQLLIRIAAASRGASWFPTTPGVRVSFPASINRFWTLVTYSGTTASRPE
jgi:hypothetical protein